MGIGRNDMEKEQSALFATAVSLGAAGTGVVRAVCEERRRCDGQNV